jgi:hypothetical protein
MSFEEYGPNGRYANQWPIRSLSGRMTQDKVCVSCGISQPQWSKGKFCSQCGKEFTKGPAHPAVYLVSLREDGHYECSCPASIYRRKVYGDCKHINFVREHETQIREAIQITRRTGTTQRIGNDEMELNIVNGHFDIELIQNGRNKAFVESFKL